MPKAAVSSAVRMEAEPQRRGASIRGIIRALDNLDDPRLQVKGDGRKVFWYCLSCGEEDGRFVECGTCPRCSKRLHLHR